MRLISLLLTLFLISVGVAFAALNAKPVEVNYFIGTKPIPLVILLLTSLIVGSLISFIILGFAILRLKTKNQWLTYKLKQAQGATQSGASVS